MLWQDLLWPLESCLMLRGLSQRSLRVAVATASFESSTNCLINLRHTHSAKLSWQRQSARGDMHDGRPEDLWSSIRMAYDTAQQSGAACRTETSLRRWADGGVTFYVRQALSLQKKPKPPAGSDQKKPVNPFLPYDDKLWVSHLSDTHTLLLNKFNVVEHHLLVVTRSFKSQLDSLQLSDFEAALLVLRAIPGSGLAFFNCGPESGASQPHKHIQIVPQPLGDDVSNPLPFEALIRHSLHASSAPACTAVPLRQLPFTSFCTQLPSRANAQDLLQAYHSLMQASGLELHHHSTSYNCWFTPELALLAPRSQEKDGPCSINTLGYAGTVLVKSDQDMEYILQKGCVEVLKCVGIPWAG